MTRRKWTGYRHTHFRPINEQRLENWLGAEKIAHLRQAMHGWYGSPINLCDVPGSVWIDADGDFVGQFTRGAFFNAIDALELFLKKLKYETAQPQYATLNAGFTSVSDALSRASSGFGQQRSVSKVGPTGVTNSASTLWRVGNQPAGGAAGGAAPGGTAHTVADTGSIPFSNPSVGANRLIGADMSGSVLGNSLLLYDRLFSVAKTINSSAAEAVTGVPTRYQSTDPLSTAEDYIGDNFLFIEVGATAMAASAHNWTGCTYTDQDNTSGVTLPSVTGVSGAIADRLDMQVNNWFCPLATGDNGIKALNNMQCNVAVATGSNNFVIGHPIGFMTFGTTAMLPFDWITNRKLAPKIFNNACLALMELAKPSATTTTYTGSIYIASTSS